MTLDQVINGLVTLTLIELMVAIGLGVTFGTRDGATIEMAQEAGRRTSSCSA
jgi:hypothetical protein